MAQRTVTLLEDDISGGEATATYTFSYGGKSYELDLNDKNGKKFTETMDFYVTHSRKSVSVSKREKDRAAANRDYNPKEVRAWAQANKIPVPDRGRIPFDVVDKFKGAK